MPRLGNVIAAQFDQWEPLLPGSLELEESIYGTTEPDAIAYCVDAFCRSALWSGIDEYLFYQSSIGSVSGVRLADGRAVVIKAHPPTQPVAYLAAMRRVQRHSPDDLWPIPHNAIFNFEATAAGAEWIDRIARTAWQTLRRDASMRVIGHTDWSVKHFRFAGDAVRVIYDWDSLRVVSEADLVGSAAATFTYTEHLDVSRHPTAEEAQAFAREYEAARGTPFTDAEWEAIGAAALYARAYGARCEHAIDPRATTFPPGSLRDMLLRCAAAGLRS